MIDKIEIQKLLIESGLPSKPLNAGSAYSDNDADIAFSVENTDLIKKAMQDNTADTPDIEKIRQELISGTLESEQNFLEAATNLYDYGI
ncbi:MAG: hypothetical protein JW715_11995 [Sedimentisphaerales bacterium]|nr:hypothetical protein [Sedimentisphaerales bacterium]